MNWQSLLPLLLVGASMVTALLIFPLGKEQRALRNTLNLTGAGLNLLLLVVMGLSTRAGVHFETRLPLLPDYDFLLVVEEVSLLFASLSAILWLFTTVYAIGYMQDEENLSRFFGFFSICVTAATGVALAGNILTFIIFYELLTLTTYPLVAHRGSEEALRAGRIYLVYTLLGGTVMLLGAVWFYAVAGPADFVRGGVLREHAPGRELELQVLFLTLIGGLGVKAAIFPLHGWLPRAMVAPAPVSALLHAVAVVKAGAFGIMRVIFDVYGVSLSFELGMSPVLAGAAAFTIVYGSVVALLQDDLKRRLVYSTVSQLSYILLGLAMLGPLGTVGGLVHLVHQGLMKITLFFAAGNLAETLGVKRISEMDGVGRRMPLTMAAFTVAALGMIGVPPVAGFVSKWYLGLGALEQGTPWLLWVLVTSSALNSAYFLPILYRAWFRSGPSVARPADGTIPRFDRAALEAERSAAQGRMQATNPRLLRGLALESSWLLLLPVAATSLLALAVGVFANLPVSPLGLARDIVLGMYR